MLLEQLKILFKKKYLWLVVMGALVGTIVIRNNLDQFTVNPPPNQAGFEELKLEIEGGFSVGKETTDKTPKRALKASLKKEPKKVVRRKKEGKVPKEPVKVEKGEKQEKAQYFFVSDKIICPWESQPLLYIVMELEFRFSEKELKREISFKEKEIEAIIQKTVFTREVKELVAPKLRRDLLRILNKYLQVGILKDIIFKDFKIEKRKK